MKNAIVLKCMLVVGIAASVALATDLLNDDFSNCAATSLNWTLSNPDSMVATCGSGVYTIQNNLKVGTGLANHAFAAKPATLTASVTITRTNDSIAAGFLICLQTSPAFAGYAIQLNAAQSIQVYKYNASGAAEIYFNTTSYLLGGAAGNVVMVGKTGNSLYLFCNGHFLDSITDAASPLANGDFALLVPPNCTATFDNVLVTDQAAIIPQQNCIADGFNDNSTFPWGDLSNLSTALEINNQYLSINTMNPGAYDYHYTDIKVDTFDSRTILSFRNGKKSSLYGFFFKGPQDSTGGVPMAFFAFNGNKQYDAFTDTITLPGSGTTFIHGPPYIAGTDTTYFWDTLEVTKTTGSHFYKMLVNGVLLDSLSDAKVDFTINGAGIFCDDSLLVYVDSFYVKSGLCSPVAYTLKNTKPPRRSVFNPQAAEYLVDPLGRRIRVLNIYNRENPRTLAPGFYISNNGKSGVVVQKY